MKKILTFVFAACLASALYAQTDIEQGSTPTYTTTVANSVAVGATGYHWTMDPSLGTVTSGGNSTAVTVNFSGAIGNTANLSVYATSTTGSCNGPTISRSYHIVAPGSITLTAAMPALANICPYDATSNPTGGDIPSNVVTFNSNVTGFSYTIDGIAQTPVTFASNTTYTLDPTTQFNNTQTGAHVLRITSATLASGTTVAYPTAAGYIPNVSITVDQAPTLNLW
jgi:hypothetical protein